MQTVTSILLVLTAGFALMLLRAYVPKDETINDFIDRLRGRKP